MSPLGQDIIEKIPWLLNEFRFRIVQDAYVPKSFGNCDVVLNGAQLRLRLVRDRGQISAYLAPVKHPEKWWDLVFLLEVINGKLPETEFKLEIVGRLLRENLPALVQALGPRWEETLRELERHGQLRLRALGSLPRSVDDGKPTWSTARGRVTRIFKKLFFRATS